MATTRNNDRQGFNSGKSLNEQVSEILNEKTSYQSKRNKLVKLGLSRDEVAILFANFAKGGVKVSDFDFSKLTFGVEIECYHCNRSELIEQGSANGLAIHSEGYNHQDNERYYKIVSDGSLSGVDNNEVVSPILKGNNGLASLKQLCKALAAVGAKVNRTCGLHVHIGAASMSDEHFCRVVRNYKRIEMAIDSFMPESRRGDNGCYCRSLRGCNLNYTTKQGIIRSFGSRYYKVNTQAYLRHKTIEFRQHSGTNDYEKISHWVTFLAKLVEYSYKHEITADVTMIEDVPFLTQEEKIYFTNRRNQLDRSRAAI